MSRWCIAAFALVLPAVAAFGGKATLPSLERHEVVVGEFTQRRHIPELARPVESRGHFAYHADHGVLWSVREPVASELVIAPGGVYQDGERVEAGGMLAPLRGLFRAVFGGDLEALHERFRVTRRDAESGWRLVLRPRGEAGPARALERLVISGSAAPRRIVIAGADGSRTELSFSGLRHPQRLDEATQRILQRDRP